MRGDVEQKAIWIYAHAGFITSSTLALISLVIPWSYQVSPTHAGFTGTPVFVVLGLRLDAVVVPAALLILLGSISLGAARAGVWLLVGAWTAAAIVLVLSFHAQCGVDKSSVPWSRLPCAVRSAPRWSRDNPRQPSYIEQLPFYGLRRTAASF